MKSIGVWCELDGKNEEELWSELECHINLWNLKRNKKRISPFIDFGISIPNFRKIKTLHFLMPFKFSENQILDLYNNVKIPDTARLIFNEIECEISSKDRYAIIKSDNFESDKLLISIKDENNLEKFVSLSDEYDDTTRVSISLEELKKDELFVPYDDLYFRFRIDSESIKEALFCPIQKKNWFLESGFVETQIIDIKINQERNLPHNICKDYRLKGYRFADFSKIHLLIMTDSSDEVDTFGSGVYECRKLEEQAWNDYLENKYDVKNVLAYHWKEKCQNGNAIQNFSRLIRISTASTNKKIIITYILVVILLGMSGSGLLELIKIILELKTMAI